MYYKKTIDVPADAKYASLEGTCAAVVDMEVVPFVLGEIPTTLKSVGKAQNAADDTTTLATTVVDSPTSSGAPAAFTMSVVTGSFMLLLVAAF